jgi:drug/metabolite transporter (DMT)-like permease
MRKTSRPDLLGVAFLTVAAIIWGFAFSAQKSAMSYMGAATSNSVRFLIGGIFLYAMLPLLDRLSKNGRSIRLREPGSPIPGLRRSELIGGAVCGAVLFLATILQQIGIRDGDVGSAAFITSLYIVIVPLINMLRGKRPGATVFIAVAIALFGAYVLSVVGESPLAESIGSVPDFFRAVGGASFSIGGAKLPVLACAVVFSLHIISIDRYTEGTDGVRLSMVQFLVAGILGIPFMLILEDPSLGQIVSGILPLLFLGICSSGIAYTLQILAQARLEATVASLVMSLESVFGALGGALFFSEKMNPAELVGCAFVFLGVTVAQLPQGLLSRKRK